MKGQVLRKCLIEGLFSVMIHTVRASMAAVFSKCLDYCVPDTDGIACPEADPPEPVSDYRSFGAMDEMEV
jgi:hypothetical protein